MADATSAARDRIDRAMSRLERKIADLRVKAAGGARVEDDDLFAGHYSAAQGDPRAEARVAELEAAGRAASDALARASEQLRGLLGSLETVEDDSDAPDKRSGEPSGETV